MPEIGGTMPSRLDPWLKLILSAAGVVGVLWGALMLFNPIGATDLNVQLASETSITLPSDIGAVPLRLTYRDQTITSALIVRAVIVNSSRNAIGSDDRKWVLSLRSPGGAVVPLGEPKPTPRDVHARFGQPTSPDTVPLEIGLLKRGESIDVNVVILNPTKASLPIEAATREKDVFPVTTRRNVTGRLRDAFAWPIFAVVTLCLLWIFIRLNRAMGRLSSPLGAIVSIAQCVLYASFGGALVAAGLGWVLAWIAVTVLSK
jgi:hypothetical protein